jgi:leader peptidase (prepilin peptidase) / N-methyltransferase
MDAPVALLHGFVVVLGLLIGSFLNVVIARLPLDQSIMRPRSRCPSCLKPIAWHDNIPVFSWLWLRGRCRHCQTSISVRYPVIELMTALLFLAAELRFGMSPVLFFRDLPFLSILVAVTFIDLEHRIIPDELSLGGLVLGLVSTILPWVFAPEAAVSSRMIGWLPSVEGAVLGFSLFFGLSWLYLHFTGRSGLGGGDVKLLAMIGAFLGPGGIFATILISSISGSVIGIGWAWWVRKHGISTTPPPAEEGESPESLMTTAIPYGPFLVIGALYYYLLGDILWFQFTIPT